MIVRCVRALPTRQQAKRLGEHFRPGLQQFGVTPGMEYVVFAIKIVGGEPWVEITDPQTRPGYLFGVPLLLFELVDSRLSAFWEARVSKNGELRFAPPSTFREYYHDDLFEGVGEVVEDFTQIREQLEGEARRQGREP